MEGPVEEDQQYDEENKKLRAFLREGFLRFMAKITNKTDCEIRMFENTTVTAKLRSFDREFENIGVENLNTPFTLVKKAILRTSDIVSISIILPNEKVASKNLL